MWYDRSRLLSYNKIMNMVLGIRGHGKTYDAKKWCISDFKKHGNQFVWLRRYKDEIDKEFKEKFFDDLNKNNEYPNDSLYIKGNSLYCNDKVMGGFYTLSTADYKKSVSFPFVNKVIFDEFIINKKGIRYLPGEAELFLSFCDTIIRLKDKQRILMLANAVSVVNPYFDYFKLRPDVTKRFNVYDRGIAIEFDDNDEEYKEARRNTDFGKLIEGTRYGGYSINNEYLLDNNIFVEQKTKDAEFMFCIKYDGIMYGFWIDYEVGLIYVNTQYDPSTYNKYVLTKEDHEPNLLLINTIKQSKPIERLVFAFQNSLVRFSDMHVKNKFYEYIQYFVRR